MTNIDRAVEVLRTANQTPVNVQDNVNHVVDGHLDSAAQALADAGTNNATDRHGVYTLASQARQIHTLRIIEHHRG